MHTDPTPLLPLGPSDMWTFANGTMVYYSPGFVHIHVDATTAAITMARELYGVMRATLLGCGLSSDDASLVVEAVERFARPITLDLV